MNSNFLNFLHVYLESNSEVDAVACDYLLVDDEEDVIEKVNSSEKPIACGILFRKSQLIEIGLYDETFLRHEERDLRLRFEKKYRINRLDIPLYRYRRHSNNITNDLEAMNHHEKRLHSKHAIS